MESWRKGELENWVVGERGGFQWKPFFVERRFIASAADFDEAMWRLGERVKVMMERENWGVGERGDFNGNHFS